VMTRGNLNPGDDDPNRPPAMTIAQTGTASIDAPLALVVNVSDDGLPKPRPTTPARAAPAGDATTIQAQANSSASARPRGLTVTWMQLRGPARVRFDRAGAILVEQGKAETSARFAERGTYVLRATANDGALSTKADVTITVGGGSTAGQR
jgi:hypothetical protein